MNKIILATFLALAVGAAFAWDTDCTLRIGSEGASCQASKECAEGLSCVKGLCSMISYGAVCSSDAECGGDYAWCISGICDVKRIPGDPCTQNLQCISGSCNNGACLALTENQNCTGGDCAKGLWCNPAQGVCQQRLGNDANCGQAYGLMISSDKYSHDLTVMCDGAKVCNAQMNNGVWTGSCQGIFSVDNSGSSCGMGLGKWQCDLGYSCTGSNNSLTCQASQGNTLCSDINSCAGISEYCLCQSTATGTVPTQSGSGSSDNSNNGVSVGGNNGVSAGDNGVSAGGNNGVNIDNSGVSAGGNNGVNIDNNGVSAGGNNGVSAGDGGVNAGGNNGVNIDNSGVSVGGNNGANAGDGGVSVGGNNGVNIDSSGVSVGGNNGVNIGKTTNQQFGETFGVCLIDQCQSNYAENYYSCLLENDCGLDATPVLIANTCANQCLNQYRDLKCCQAGFNIGNVPVTTTSNGRLIVVNTQGLNCQNTQPPQIVDSGSSHMVASVLGVAGLLALAL